MGVAYIEFALAHPGLFRLMFGPLLRERDRFAELGAAADDAFAVLHGRRAVISSAMRDEDVESVAYAAWSFAHGLARLVLDEVIPRERALKVCSAFPFGRAD